MAITITGQSVAVPAKSLVDILVPKLVWVTLLSLVPYNPPNAGKEAAFPRCAEKLLE